MKKLRSRNTFKHEMRPSNHFLPFGAQFPCFDQPRCCLQLWTCHWLQNETKCGNNKFDHLIVLYTEFDLRAPTPTFEHCAGEDVWPLLALEVSWVSWHVQNVRRRGVVEESKTSEPQCLESHLGLSLRFANCEQLDLMH